MWIQVRVGNKKLPEQCCKGSVAAVVRIDRAGIQRSRQNVRTKVMDICPTKKSNSRCHRYRHRQQKARHGLPITLHSTIKKKRRAVNLQTEGRTAQESTRPSAPALQAI